MSLAFLESSIKARIEELNNTFEDSPKVVAALERNEKIIELLLKIVPKEFWKLLDEFDGNYMHLVTEAEDVYYKAGFADALQLKHEINGLPSPVPAFQIEVERLAH